MSAYDAKGNVSQKTHTVILNPSEESQKPQHCQNKNKTLGASFSLLPKLLQNYKNY
jgi:hypothetical protein